MLAKRHGSCSTSLHNPQNLAICGTKLLCEAYHVYTIPFSPLAPKCKRKMQSGHVRLRPTLLRGLLLLVNLVHG